MEHESITIIAEHADIQIYMYYTATDVYYS